MDYIIDTREQKPLLLKNKNDTAIFKCLKTGDYSLKGYENKIAIERKSLPDLFKTLGSGHKRFRLELERAKKLDYFAVIIEGSYQKIMNKKFKGSKYIKINSSTISAILFTLHLKYGLNIFFATNRLEAAKIVKEIFKSFIKLKKIKF